jgi:uncharacterized protein YfkK (UPF0435 family)
MNDIWIDCIRNKYRFEFKGLISAEDLFDLKLEDLDVIYKGLKKEEQELLGDSLLETAENPAKREVEAKIDIVKSIFAIKKVEMENAKRALENKAQKAKILAIIENKQDQELSEKSIEELRKIYDSLE